MTFEDARLYLVAPHRLEKVLLAEIVGELADAGVDVIQLREKTMEAGDIVAVGRPLRDACADSGIPFFVNDRPDIALALAADGIHLGQNDIPPAIARRVAPAAMLGLSTHAPEEIDAALMLAPRPDYIAVGPVFETPTKAGRPAAGLQLVRQAAAAADLPWFAIGGIDESTLPEVLGAGAKRVVVVRAITQADDPVAAAAGLRRMLDEAG